MSDYFAPRSVHEALARRVTEIERNYERSITTEGVSRTTTPTAGIMGRLRFLTDMLGGVLAVDTGSAWRAVNQAPGCLVANLPTASDGTLAYASDGLKTGESSGAGTGVMVYASGGLWYRMSDDSVVAT